MSRWTLVIFIMSLIIACKVLSSLKPVRSVNFDWLTAPTVNFASTARGNLPAIVLTCRSASNENSAGAPLDNDAVLPNIIE